MLALPPGSLFSKPAAVCWCPRRHLTEYWGLFADQLTHGEFTRITNFTWKAVSVHAPGGHTFQACWRSLLDLLPETSCYTDNL
jgi:hypothetical protein